MKELYIATVVVLFSNDEYKVESFNNRQDAEDAANLAELENSNCLVEIHEHYLTV